MFTVQGLYHGYKFKQGEGNKAWIDWFQAKTAGSSKVWERDREQFRV